MSFNSQTPVDVTPSKRRVVTMLEAWVLLCPCLCYGLLGVAPMVTYLAAVPLLLSLLITKPLPPTARSGIYSVVIAGVVAVLLNQVYKVEEFRFFLPVPVMFPFLIGLGIAATFFRQSPVSIGNVLSVSAMALMLQGSSLQDPPTLVDYSRHWSDRFFVFGFFLALQMIGFLPLLYMAQTQRRLANAADPAGKPIDGTAVPASVAAPRRTGALSARFAPRAIYLGSAIFTLIVVLVANSVAEPIYRRMDRVLSPVYQWYIRQQQNKLLFPPDKINLTQTLSAKDFGNFAQVTYRVASPQPPGYMRGRVYNIYERGSWKPADTSDLMARVTLADNSSVASYRFFRPELKQDVAEAQATVTLDVYPASSFMSDVLFSPGNAVMTELIAESVSTNADGVLSPRRWDEQGAYSMMVPKSDQESAYQNLSLDPAKSTWYTQVPPDLLPFLKTYNAQIFAGTSGLTPEKKMTLIRDWLRDHNEYSLEIKMDQDSDPMEQFLTQTKAGHCELFASATALLLRAQGIPTRYVTGFLVYEPHPSNGYWVARLGDCHAWVEAWDAKARRWRVVESTPASGIPNGAIRTSGWRSQLESLKLALASLYAKIKRGYFAEAIFGVVFAIGRAVRWLFWSGPWYLGWGVLVAVATLVYRAYMVRHRERNRRRLAGDASREELRRLLARLERTLARQQVKRSPTMSLGEFIALLQARAVPRAAALGDWLRDYERLRYSPEPPAEPVVAEFANRLRAVLDARSTDA